jgi:hypothetical protein
MTTASARWCRAASATRLGTDGGEKLGDTVAAKFNLEDEIIYGSIVKFIWRVIFRGHRRE